jgi:hypothetical protein
MVASFTISPVLYLLLSHLIGSFSPHSSNPGLIKRLLPGVGSGSGSGSTVPPPSPEDNLTLNKR